MRIGEGDMKTALAILALVAIAALLVGLNDGRAQGGPSTLITRSTGQTSSEQHPTQLPTSPPQQMLQQTLPEAPRHQVTTPEQHPTQALTLEQQRHAQAQADQALARITGDHKALQTAV